MPGSDIVSLSGTVNGSAIIWNKSGNSFSAVVPKSANGEYSISLSARDEAGNIAVFNSSVHLGLAFVTDRTEGSFYNASDLNRVEDAVSAISKLLLNLGYPTDVVTRSWNIGDLPTKSDMSRFLDNIRALVNAFFVLPSTPSLPTNMDFLTFQRANDIERVLFDIFSLISNTVANFRFCGEIFSGEDDLA